MTLNRIKKAFAQTLIAFLVSSFAGHVQAQDLLITANMDSINCNIISVGRDSIYYATGPDSSAAKTAIPTAYMKKYLYDYYVPSETPAVRKYEWQHVRIGLSGGYGRRLNKISDQIPEQYRDYYSKQKNGYQFNAIIQYFFNESYGLGATYRCFKSKTEYSNSYTTNSYWGQYIISEYKRDFITITYIAPVFSVRFYDATNSDALLMNYSAGYLEYYDQCANNVTLKGNTLGLSLGIGYDFRVNENFAIGLDANYISGVISELTVTENRHSSTVKLDGGNKEGLHRLDFSIGLRLLN